MDELIILTPILAHTAPGSGAIEGFLHPILGLTHLIAMVVVGVLSAQLGGRAIWTVPATFLAMMTVGGVIALIGVELPFVDAAIAASIIALGLLLLFKVAMSEVVAMITVGFFAIFHGYAHGASLPENVDDIVIIIAYVVGFLVSTAGLHVIGALLGYINQRNQRSQTVLRVVAVMTSLAGVVFLINP